MKILVLATLAITAVAGCSSSTKSRPLTAQTLRVTITKTTTETTTETATDATTATATETTTRTKTVTASPSTATSKPKPPPATTHADVPSNVTPAQQQAISSAQDYLDTQAFSRQGLIDQLSSSYGDGFSKSDATVAVDSLNENWNKEAAKAAKEYLSTEHFSCSGLIDQLSSSYGDQFTYAQAQYGAQQSGIC